MKEEKIKEIMNDPNTWAWDGCTYPEDDPHGKEFHEEQDKHFAEMMKELGIKPLNNKEKYEKYM